MRLVRSLLFLAIALIGGAVLWLFHLKLQPIKPVFPEEGRGIIPGSLTEPTVAFINPQRGSKYAPVTLVVFSDFACGHCKTLNEQLQQLTPDIQNNIRVVWKHAPNDIENPLAKTLSVAAACAGHQGAFWPFHDELYAAQPFVTETTLPQIAKNVGIDTDVFQRCLENRETAPLVEHDIDEAIALGLSATPTVFVGTERLVGSLSTEELTALVERHLATP